MNEELMVIKKEMEKTIGDMMGKIIFASKAIGSITDIVTTLNHTVEEHDTLLKKRVYVSQIHCRLITKTIKTRVSDLCNEHSVIYASTAKHIFPCIYNMLYEAYGVNSYRELPDIYFDDIMERIRKWDDMDKVMKRIEAA